MARPRISNNNSAKKAVGNNKRRKKPQGGALFKLLLLLILAFAVLVGGLLWWVNTPIPLKSSPLDVHIREGSGLRAALKQIDEAGAPVWPLPFIVLARVMGSEKGIKAGSYELTAPLTPLDLLGKLVRGEVSQADVVIPEGWTFRQIRARIDAHPQIRHDSKALSDAELVTRLGIVGTSPEGWLFPDTYLFDKRSSDLAIYARAYRAMKRRLELSWSERGPDSPLKSPYEALILASIVEKETGRDADRALVSAVFVNRLKRGMLLQTDPTVIYGLGEGFDGNLRKRDLQTDTPYNTYLRPGLPPTPIAMPGDASLRAALHPQASEALYFVARGDGSSEFSATLDDHNRAVNRYQRPGR